MSKKGCSRIIPPVKVSSAISKQKCSMVTTWDDYSIDEFIQKVNDYMQWYCRDRIKTTLGGLSPLDYRRSIGVCVLKNVRMSDFQNR